MTCVEPIVPPAREGELHVIGETVSEMLDHVSARPASGHPHLPALIQRRSPPMKFSSPGAQQSPPQ
jgi:hypothetical protein